MLLISIKCFDLKRIFCGILFFFVVQNKPIESHNKEIEGISIIEEHNKAIATVPSIFIPEIEVYIQKQKEEIANITANINQQQEQMNACNTVVQTMTPLFVQQSICFQGVFGTLVDTIYSVPSNPSCMETLSSFPGIELVPGTLPNCVGRRGSYSNDPSQNVYIPELGITISPQGGLARGSTITIMQSRNYKVPFYGTNTQSITIYGASVSPSMLSLILKGINQYYLLNSPACAVVTMPTSLIPTFQKCMANATPSDTQLVPITGFPNALVATLRRNLVSKNKYDTNATSGTFDNYENEDGYNSDN